MELWEIGLSVVIQFPGLRPNELKAFHRGFKSYGYLESSTPGPGYKYPPDNHLTVLREVIFYETDFMENDESHFTINEYADI
jgi:hypothetical protein